MTLQEKVNKNIKLTTEEVEELKKIMDPSLFIPYNQAAKDKESARDFRTDEEKMLDGDLPLPPELKIVDGKIERKSDNEMYKEGLLTKEQYSVLKRSERDYELEMTDKYVLPDFPISSVDIQKVFEYREYLRHLPEQPDWPDVDVKRFSL